MPRSRDTTDEADEVQLAVLRRMTVAQRTSLANQMSTAARETTLAAIKARHPDYSEEHARWALFRLVVGDDLFKRAWPRAPLVDP